MKLSLTRLLIVGLLLGTPALSGSCSDSSQEKLTLATLSEGCVINSDCSSPLVCAFKRCHTECESSRDCDPGQRCVLADRPFHVCQLPEETACNFNSDCPEGQVCGVDAECRDQCATDRDCVVGQLCVTGTCAEPEELDENGKLPEAGTGTSGGVGRPCSYTSECPAGLVCRSGLCGYECQTSTDCPPGTVCVDKQCGVPVCDSVGGNPVDAGAPCRYDSQCPSGLVCRFGTCTCECLSDDDCSAPATCVQNRCSEPPPPDAGAPDASDAGDGGPLATGLPDWTRTVDSGSYSVSAIATGPSGKVHVTGTFFGTVNIGVGDLISGGTGCNALLLVYDDQGGVQKARTYGGTGCPNPTDLAVDAAGNTYLVGYYGTALTLGTFPLPAPTTGNGLFVAKLDAAGIVSWAKSYGGVSFSSMNAVAVSSTGNVVVGGAMYEALDFGAGPLPYTASADAFAAVLDSAGNHVWSKSWGSADSEQVTDVISVGNDVILSGTYYVDLSFGSTSVLAGGTVAPDAFVVRLDATGAAVTAQGYPDSAAQVVHGSSYAVAGSHPGGVSFGGSTFAAPGVYVARYDDAGSHLWSVSFPATDTFVNGIAVAGAGDIVIAGGTSGSVDFGGGPITGAVEQTHLFVAKLARDSGEVLWSHGTTDPNADAGVGFASGYLGGLSADFDGNSYVSLVAQGGELSLGGLLLRGSGTPILLKLLP